ncbi:MAG TPA: hypothetical protein VIY86_13865, partial [Pirellulaceae bacterium]
VTLLENSDVVVTARLDANRTIRYSEVCRISTGNILGDAVLEFVPSGVRMPSADVYKDEDYLDGVVAKNPLTVMESVQSALQIVANLEGDVRQTLVSIEGAGQEVGGMARSLGALVQNNDDQFQRIVMKAERAMDRFDTAASAVDEFVRDSDVKQLLEQSLRQVPDLLTDAREVMESLKGLATRADQNLANLEKITEPLGANGARLAENLDSSLTQLDDLLAQMVQFTKALNQPDSTIGQLVNNRELYDRLDGAAANIEQLSRRLRPIVEDTRVIADKIARNPGQLGVKGLLDRTQSGLKRYSGGE